MLKLELNDTNLFLVEELETLPDFPPIKKVIPIMTKEIFVKCYHEWILKDAIKIVRCKDCKWYRNKDDQHYCFMAGIDYPLPDDFCSMGELGEDPSHRPPKA